MSKELIRSVLKNTLIIAGFSYCNDHWDEDPIVCTAICALGTMLGARLTYCSVKKSYAICKPYIKSFIKKAISKSDNSPLL